MLVDIHARQKRRVPKYELQTFYGQLQHIFVVKFSDACADLGLDEPTTVILAAIRNCLLEPNDARLQRLDVHFYSKTGALNLVDIVSIQSLVGRIKDGQRWAIIDRSGALARAAYDGDEEA